MGLFVSSKVYYKATVQESKKLFKISFKKFWRLEKSCYLCRPKRGKAVTDRSKKEEKASVASKNKQVSI